VLDKPSEHGAYSDILEVKKNLKGWPLHVFLYMQKLCIIIYAKRIVCDHAASLSNSAPFFILCVHTSDCNRTSMISLGAGIFFHYTQIPEHNCGTSLQK
jgi:hypothetical protein